MISEDYLRRANTAEMILKEQLKAVIFLTNLVEGVWFLSNVDLPFKISSLLLTWVSKLQEMDELSLSLSLFVPGPSASWSCFGGSLFVATPAIYLGSVITSGSIGRVASTLKRIPEEVRLPKTASNWIDEKLVLNEAGRGVGAVKILSAAACSGSLPRCLDEQRHRKMHCWARYSV